jgi:hypothetical protein
MPGGDAACYNLGFEKLKNLFYFAGRADHKTKGETPFNS